MRFAILALSLMLLLPLRPARVDADGPAPSGWEQLGLVGSVYGLMTPLSGAFFAVTDDGLLRSNDGGVSWQAVNVPPMSTTARRDPQSYAITPTDHTRLFVFGQGGLHRSLDDAASWSLVFPVMGGNRGFAVSPADPAAVWFGLAGPEAISGDFRFLRSLDGGESWELLREYHNSLCGWGMPVLAPHATDPQRLYRAAACYAGRNLSDDIHQSVDGGEIFAPFTPNIAGFWPRYLAGGQGAAPTRYYTAGDLRGLTDGGFLVLRTDDDGASWTRLHESLQQWEPGTPPPAVTRAAGLESDPVAPDRVYLAIHDQSGGSGPISYSAGRVLRSEDAGLTWAPLADADFGRMYDLVLGVDGANLYVASSTGLWRYSIAP